MITIKRRIGRLDDLFDVSNFYYFGILFTFLIKSLNINNIEEILKLKLNKNYYVLPDNIEDLLLKFNNEYKEQMYQQFGRIFNLVGFVGKNYYCLSIKHPEDLVMTQVNINDIIKITGDNDFLDNLNNLKYEIKCNCINLFNFDEAYNLIKHLNDKYEVILSLLGYSKINI